MNAAYYKIVSGIKGWKLIPQRAENACDEIKKRSRLYIDKWVAANGYHVLGRRGRLADFSSHMRNYALEHLIEPLIHHNQIYNTSINPIDNKRSAMYVDEWVAANGYEVLGRKGKLKDFSSGVRNYAHEHLVEPLIHHPQIFNTSINPIDKKKTNNVIATGQGNDIKFETLRYVQKRYWEVGKSSQIFL